MKRSRGGRRRRGSSGASKRKLGVAASILSGGTVRRHDGPTLRNMFEVWGRITHVSDQKQRMGFNNQPHPVWYMTIQICDIPGADEEENEEKRLEMDVRVIKKTQETFSPDLDDFKHTVVLQPGDHFTFSTSDAQVASIPRGCWVRVQSIEYLLWGKACTKKTCKLLEADPANHDRLHTVRLLTSVDLVTEPDDEQVEQMERTMEKYAPPLYGIVLRDKEDKFAKVDTRGRASMRVMVIGPFEGGSRTYHCNVMDFPILKYTQLTDADLKATIYEGQSLTFRCDIGGRDVRCGDIVGLEGLEFRKWWSIKDQSIHTNVEVDWMFPVEGLESYRYAGQLLRDTGFVQRRPLVELEWPEDYTDNDDHDQPQQQQQMLGGGGGGGDGDGYKRTHGTRLYVMDLTCNAQLNHDVHVNGDDGADDMEATQPYQSSRSVSMDEDEDENYDDDDDDDDIATMDDTGSTSPSTFVSLITNLGESKFKRDISKEPNTKNFVPSYFAPFVGVQHTYAADDDEEEEEEDQEQGQEGERERDEYTGTGAIFQGELNMYENNIGAWRMDEDIEAFEQLVPGLMQWLANQRQHANNNDDDEEEEEENGILCVATENMAGSMSRSTHEISEKSAFYIVLHGLAQILDLRACIEHAGIPIPADQIELVVQPWTGAGPGSARVTNEAANGESVFCLDPNAVDSLPMLHTLAGLNCYAFFLVPNLNVFAKNLEDSGCAGQLNDRQKLLLFCADFVENAKELWRAKRRRKKPEEVAAFERTYTIMLDTDNENDADDIFERYMDLTSSMKQNPLLYRIFAVAKEDTFATQNFFDHLKRLFGGDTPGYAEFCKRVRVPPNAGESAPKRPRLT